MKKIGIFMAVLVAAFVSAVSCTKSTKSNENMVYAAIEGEWHMTSWSGEMSESIDVYVEFNADRTFVLYQKLKKQYFVKYAGQYSIVDNVLTGLYDDNTPLNSSYNVDLNSDNTRLTLSSREHPDDITIFAKEPIPSTVVDGARRLTSRGETVLDVRKFL